MRTLTINETPLAVGEMLSRNKARTERAARWNRLCTNAVNLFFAAVLGIAAGLMLFGTGYAIGYGLTAAVSETALFYWRLVQP